MSSLDEKKLFEKVNLNSEYRNIAEEYICKYYGNMFNLEDARILAKYLLLELNYTKESILNGYADDFIINRGKFVVARRKSVRNPQEEIITIKLKTKKELISMKKLKTLIISFLIVASIPTAFALRFNDNYGNLKESTGIKLGQIASGDYDEETTILIQSSPAFDKSEKYVPLYEKAAATILNVIIKDPSLFDVTIYDTYYNIDKDRLDNFSITWNTMINYMANDEAFSPIYAKLGNQSFLGYVLNMLTQRGDIVHYDSEYQKYVDVINEYNKVGSYENLSRLSKFTVQDMMEKYYKLGKELYKASKKPINDLIKTEKKMGGR